VLLKGTKLGQSLKVDLPTIGPHTIERAARAGLAGMVVEAGRVLVIDGQAVIAAADAAGLFLFGLKRVHPL
jgi:UDP-2,3-diacylglucosamine hydrolase